MAEEKTCETCMYMDKRLDTPCYCCHDKDRWIQNPWLRIEELEDELALWKMETYFCYKIGITIAATCYNEESKLCIKCKMPECALAGWKQPKGHVSHRRRRQADLKKAEALIDRMVGK